MRCATLTYPNTKRGCRPTCSSARESRVHGPTTSMSWSRLTRAGRTVCCFATICAHPETASAYGSLKKSLALAFGDDIEGFRNAKGEFVKTVTEKARSEFGPR